MKVTKYVHSCLYVEDKGMAALIDPGNYTYEEKALDLEKLRKPDYILITHEHADHLHLPLLKRILKKFPAAKIISNDSVAAILEKENITVLAKGDNNIKIEYVPHEKVLGFTPKNVKFEVFGRLTHPGDSHSFRKTAEILAMPVQAPWGSFVNAIEKAAELKPKIVIPIHDWHWNDKARAALYQRAAEYLKQHGIEFKTLETGKEVEM